MAAAACVAAAMAEAESAAGAVVWPEAEAAAVPVVGPEAEAAAVPVSEAPPAPEDGATAPEGGGVAGVVQYR